jgi:hypothetical protein
METMHVTVDALIRELLATGQMNEDTTADLNRMLAEFEAGTLDPDDADYVRAFHARVTGAPAAEIEADPVASESRLDGLTIAEWRDRALAAEARLGELEEAATTSEGI